MTYHESMKYYKKEEGRKGIICLLCRHACKLKEGQAGYSVTTNRLSDGCCPHCSKPISGVCS